MVNMVLSDDILSQKVWKELGFDIIGRLPLAAQLETDQGFVEGFILGIDLGT